MKLIVELTNKIKSDYPFNKVNQINNDTIQIARKLNAADITKIYNYYNNLIETKGIFSSGNIDIVCINPNITKLKFYIDLPF